MVTIILNPISETYKIKLRPSFALLRKDQFLFIRKLTPVATPIAIILAEITSTPIPLRNPRKSNSSRSAVEPPTIMYLINMVFPSQASLLLNSPANRFDYTFSLFGDNIAGSSFDFVINF